MNELIVAWNQITSGNEFFVDYLFLNKAITEMLGTFVSRINLTRPNNCLPTNPVAFDSSNNL